MYHLDYLDSASQDLEDIYVYLFKETADDAYAEQFVRKLLGRLLKIRSNPTIFKRQRIAGKRFYRVSHKPYYIYYFIENDTIFVQRILHHRRRQLSGHFR